LNLEYNFQFPLPNGLHARPASHLQELTNRFESDIRLINLRSRQEADAKSVLSLVIADVKSGEPCKIVFSGKDHRAAFDAVTQFLTGDFLSCDEALPEVEAKAGVVRLPRSLRKAGPKKFHIGRGLIGGIGWGKAVVAGGLKLPAGLESQKADDPAQEQETVARAIATVCGRLSAGIKSAVYAQETEVLKAHLAIVQDRAFSGEISRLIYSEKMTAGRAVVAASRHFASILGKAGSLYLRERVLDIEDVCGQLLAEIYGADAGAEKLILDGPSICIAENLTPGQFLSLDRALLKALVLGHAGTTSHTVILARSFGVPTLTGLADAPLLLQTGQEIIVDANLGIVIPEVTEPVARYYRRELDKVALLQQKLAAFQKQDAKTKDGHRIEIAANVASAVETVHAFEAGAEGIGLFRTEMLFMDRETAPTEEEQTAIYTAAVKAGGERTVIIRTLDIGGDKPVSYLGLPPETNPFLGFRGVRIYREFSGLIKTQLRALLRAAGHGALRVMVPMVSCVEEIRYVKTLLAEAREELRAAGVEAADAPVELGVMLEIPSVAFLMPQLCAEVDFFSIGTNDLTQYFLAADRDNAKVAALYSSLHPGFLRLLKTLIDGAHRGGKWIGLCGEMGENAQLLPLLIGLGLDEISLSGPRIAATKAAVCRADFSRCVELAERVLTASVREEVAAHLESFGNAERALSILTPELVILESDADSKEEAIKELVDALHLSGRTDRPECVEEEIWAREETYSTGFGGGFAIPHCKSSHLAANSIVILKTRAGGPGIEWNSLDGAPVRVALLLAIRTDNAGSEHLKTLARLSRQVMNDEFRARLLSENDPAELTGYVLGGLPNGSES
jgi:fructose-specific PTS system IIA-like component